MPEAVLIAIVQGIVQLIQTALQHCENNPPPADAPSEEKDAHTRTVAQLNAARDALST